MRPDPSLRADADERDVAALRAFRDALGHLLSQEAGEPCAPTTLDDDVPTLFLDPALIMRAFTRAAGPLFRVRASDIGKSVAEIAAAIGDPWLFDDSRAVIAAHGAISREVRRDGVWRLRRMAPDRAFRKGVEGVIVTSVDIDRRKRVCAAVAAVGGAHLDADAAASLLAEIERALIARRERAGAAEARLSGLSPRQREVLTHVVEGSSSKVIAYALGVSPRTVENHRAALMRRLGVRSLPALVRVALLARDGG